MSHNSMGAFYSNTDDASDKSGIYYSAVIGKLKDDSFEYVIRFNLYEQKKKCTLDEVFVIPEVKKVIVPAEWLAQVDEKSYTTTKSLPATHRQHPSLWDQRSNGTSWGLPGFDEISPGDFDFNKGKGKGNGGQKNQPKKEETFDDWPYTQQRTCDMPDPLTFSEETDDIAPSDLEYHELGKEVAEAYEMITTFLTDLEEQDEPLLEVIQEAYALLSDSGRMIIATNGMR